MWSWTSTSINLEWRLFDENKQAKISETDDK